MVTPTRAMRAAVLLLAIVPAVPAAAQTPAPQAAPVVPLGTTMMMPAAMGSAESALFRRLLPTVVNITIRKDTKRPSSATNAGGAETATTRAFGSGFVIDPSGIIATNFHVVDDAWQIDVGFHDGTHATGHLLHATRLIDVALIKVDVGHPLPAVTLGIDSEDFAGWGSGDSRSATHLAWGYPSRGGTRQSALHRDIIDSFAIR